MGREHVSKSEYEGVIKEMEADLQRTERKREIERAFEGNIAQVMQSLEESEGGNKSAMMRKINDQLDSDTELSRSTFYKYYEEYVEQ